MGHENRGRNGNSFRKTRQGGRETVGWWGGDGGTERKKWGAES